MNGLFIRLYLDENVHLLVSKLLQARGFEVTSVHATQRFGLTDEEQLAYSTEIEAALVTHNRVDFEMLAETWRAAGRRHAGMIIAVQRPPRMIAERLLGMLNEITADEMVNQVRYI